MKKTFTFWKSLFLLCALIVGSSSAWAETTTYQHVFNAKPSTGSNVTLSGVKWDISATNLGNYNSANYAGVQIGTSNKNGAITLTSSSVWGTETGTYKDKTVITEVRLWLNRGGSSVTPSVTIGGKSATSDGTTVAKNSSAGSDWKKATKVTFTPATNGNTGIVVIEVTSVNAGYICAMEIDCEESTGPTTYSVNYNSNGATSGTAPTDATAYSPGDEVTVLGNTGNLERTSFSFAGWNTESNGTGTSYSAGDKFTISASTTLYAKWNFIVADGVFDFVNAASAGEDYGSGVTLTSDAYTTGNKTWTAGNVTMVTSDGGGDGIRWWSSDGTLRFYNKATATFSVPSGYVITKIETTGANFNSANVGTLSGSTWTGASNSVELSVNATRNIKTITVTYYASPFTAATVSSAGWATYVTPVNVQFEDNTAYIVTSVGNSIKAESITQVPANTPILLKGEGPKTATVITNPSAPETNLLAISDGDDGVGDYVLYKDNSHDVGFYKWNGEPLAKGKVYLPADAVGNARDFLGFEETTTGINTIQNSQIMIDNEAPIYNLAGQRVTKSYKGVVIVNGKKMLNK